MVRGTRVAAAIGAVALLGLAALPVGGVVDRLLPHAIVLWDDNSCGPATADNHDISAVAGPILPQGHGSIQIISAKPLGLSDGAHWRMWVVPVERGAGYTGSLGTDDPPAGWSTRTPAAGATVSGASPSELDIELWPGDGARTTSLRGILVTYRTTLGLVREVRTTTSLSTRVGGCV